ncbi:hypothetical protein N7478_011674 [Penicillium angulare]|uniref:uncharacterized protein n=1 Tax=Penicillium angulare TaxID=116970 RepID=UPI00254252BC|nr:uncharacterized protein N7478_011674 [Penicillium angulare]KAJ5261079.1 hypothetical protein N7478_011674 [Penicillium angulare]
MAPVTDAVDQYTSSVVKSCGRCRTRKVKCSACARHNETCNITDYVAYPYSVVEKLHARVQELEQRLLGLRSTSPAANAAEPIQPSTINPLGQQSTTNRLLWSADVTKEAEEVGVLAIGFQDPYSHTKYG